MSQPPSERRPAPRSYWRIEPDLGAVLRLPSFNLYAVSRVASSAASNLLQAIVLWQVYDQTGSVVDLGVVGLMRLVPTLAMSFVSGAVADARDMRGVLQVSQVVPFVTTLLMLGGLVAGGGEVPLLGIYALVVVTALATSFEFPARQVLLRAVVPHTLYARALTVNSTLHSLATTLGPAVGGVLIAWGGVEAAYAAHAVLIVTAILPVAVLHPAVRVASERRKLDFGSIREGIVFLRHQPVLMGAITLDLFAVIFGGAAALLPVYAVDVLHVGPAGYGLLSASLRAGALVSALILMILPIPDRIGRALLTTVGIFGLATAVFGLSTWLPLSILAYAAVGAADKVSVILRMNVIQLNTPDALRGRVTAVTTAFVTGSEQLGGIESGFVAAVTNAVFAVVSGGIACVGVVGFIAWRIPELRCYRRSA